MQVEVLTVYMNSKVIVNITTIILSTLTHFVSPTGMITILLCGASYPLDNKSWCETTAIAYRQTICVGTHVVVNVVNVAPMWTNAPLVTWYATTLLSMTPFTINLPHDYPLPSCSQ